MPNESEKRTGRYRGKSPVVREALVGELRKMLLGGVWKPGEKLPPRLWFVERFNAASHTVQDAFSELLADGFLTCIHRVGTQVAVRPSYWKHYALILGGEHPEPRGSVRSYQEAAKILRRGGLDIEIFYSNEKKFKEPEYLALLRKFRRRCFTGAFFVSLPETLVMREQLYQLGEFPITGAFSQDLNRGSLVCMRCPNGERQHERRMAREFVRLGIRRVGVVQYTSLTHPMFAEAQYRRMFDELGLEMPECGYLKVFDLDMFCHSALKLYLRQFSPENPGGVIVSDDNILGSVVSVLRELYGERAPAACRIVAFGNYPLWFRPDYPVKWFCADNLTTLRNGLDWLDRAQAGPVEPAVRGSTLEDTPDGWVHLE